MRLSAREPVAEAPVAEVQPNPGRVLSRIGRCAAVALGWTTVTMTAVIEPLVRPDHGSLIYHWSGRPAVLYGPVLVEMLLLTVLVTALLLTVPRPGRWRTVVYAALVLPMPWILLSALKMLWFNRVPAGAHLPSIGWAVAALVLLAVLWRPGSEAWAERGVGLVSAVLTACAFSGALFAAQMGWTWWEARGLNEPRPLRPVAASAGTPASGRVVWLVLDELSYEQVYERRYPGLALPNFDRLAGESTVFTDVVPAGDKTDRVLPSLLTGEPVRDIRGTADGALLLQTADHGRWKHFDARNTVFGDAVDAGYTTAVDGWYNPYCRLLPTVVSRCTWALNGALQSGMVPQASFGYNLEQAIGATLGAGHVNQLLWPLLGKPKVIPGPPALHIGDLNQLLAESDQLLRDPGIGFALVHVPIPHPEGIYDRATGRMSTGASSYVDNLALCDAFLGHVRQVLQEGGRWDRTTLVVMGDHSWRTATLWRHAAGWTAEDERASGGGQFDPRPMYLVKLPGQHDGVRVTAPFRATETRALLDGVLHGKLEMPGQLVSWARHAASIETQAASLQ